jgi:hypothetical protein
MESGRKGRGTEWREGKEGRGGKEKEREGREMEGPGIGEGVCVMVFGGWTPLDTVPMQLGAQRTTLYPLFTKRVECFPSTVFYFMFNVKFN